MPYDPQERARRRQLMTRRFLHEARRTAGVLMAVVCVALAAGHGVLAQADEAAVGRAFFTALASGDGAAFEAMAQERFAPALLARRSPADRAQMVQRINGEFGTLSLGGIRVVNDELSLMIRGSKGLSGRIVLTIEPAPPHRITAAAVEVGDDEPESPAPPVPITGAMAPAEMSRALDAYLAARASAGEFSGVVAVAKSGAAIFQHAYGLADREKKTPPAPATRFNVASIGKAFTKTAVGQLMAQGKLALTDTIGKWLPDYPNVKARGATVEQLLTHQGGVADFFGPEFAAAPKSQFASNADYYRYVSAKPLLFDPGTNRQYCNGCYVVLGEIVAKASGQRYEDYIAAHVFKPAGMIGAAFLRADALPADAAQQYSKELPTSNGQWVNARDAHGVTGSAAGGCYATAADLLAFDNAIRTGKLLDPKMTGWFLEDDAPAAGARAKGGIGFAGGAPGTNALLETDDLWAVAVVGNLDPPASINVGMAIKKALGERK